MGANATNDQETTLEGEGSETTPNATGSDPAAEIASARKRQAGAEAARQAAVARATELEAKLAKYETANQTAAEKDMTDLARQTARAEAAEKKAAEAEEKATARILDARFPNARKELPELTDEVRLAKFEAMLADGGEVPTPMQHSESKSSSAAAPKERSLAEVKADLLKMPMPEGF